MKKISFSLLIIMVLISCVGCTDAASTDEGKVVVEYNGCLGQIDLVGLVMESSVVVYGKVIDESNSIKIQPVNGGEIEVYTDYTIASSQILKGQEKVSDENAISVRILGGETDKQIHISDYTAQLVVGEEYLLFLYKTNHGGHCKTKGDYYYVVGQKQGSFAENASNMFVSQGKNAVLEDIDLDSFMNDIDGIIEENIDTYVMPDPYANIEGNLARGMITEEEAERFRKELSMYAQIIE